MDAALEAVEMGEESAPVVCGMPEHLGAIVAAAAAVVAEPSGEQSSEYGALVDGLLGEALPVPAVDPSVAPVLDPVAPVAPVAGESPAAAFLASFHAAHQHERAPGGDLLLVVRIPEISAWGLIGDAEAAGKKPAEYFQNSVDYGLKADWFRGTGN
jgi:hypothetical protein